MNAILDQLEDEAVRRQVARIYSTGLSDGALFTSLLACTMNDRFAAFAPVAGVVMPTPCHPGRPVPIMAFHGTADPTLPFNGGTPGTTPPPVNLHGPGYPANVQAWAVKDGCDPVSTDTQVTAHVILRTYHCPPGAAVDVLHRRGWRPRLARETSSAPSTVPRPSRSTPPTSSGRSSVSTDCRARRSRRRRRRSVYAGRPRQAHGFAPQPS